MTHAPSVAFAANEDRLAGAAAAAVAPGDGPEDGSDDGPDDGPGDGPEDGSDDGSSGAAVLERHRHCVSLKGTTRGLEILISGAPPVAALGARLTELLAEAPGFFAGSDARVAIDGALPGGALACLEEVAARFELRIVEISPAVARRRRIEVPRSLRPEDVRQARLAEGTGPVSDALELLSGDPGCAIAAPSAVVDAQSAVGLAPSAVAVAPQAAAAIADADPAPGVVAVPPGPRLVIGPLRSGTIVEHAGHLIVLGDVNPGAEVRAEGSIIVLGRMRGVAHAAIACDGGFIVALSLQPQQLRIGRMVARADDADRGGDGAEIAYATGETIVVERFWGRLPSGLAASM